MIVFVDTSAFYALLDGSDQDHSRAVGVWENLLHQQASLLTTNYVLVETSALLQRRLGPAALRAFQEDVVPLLTVDWILEQRHETGVEAVLAAGRRRLSLVDCVSFQTMRAHGIHTAFCFDAHFREQGFEVLL